MKLRISMLLTLVVLAGCSVRECKLDGAYLESQETGALVNPGNGELPARDPAYDIPPIPEQELVSGRTYATTSGEEVTDCIDRPPRLPAKADQ